MCLLKRALHPPRSFLWEVLAEAQPQALRLPILGSSLRIKTHKVSLTLEKISLALIKYNHFHRKANNAPVGRGTSTIGTVPPQSLHARANEKRKHFLPCVLPG